MITISISANPQTHTYNSCEVHWNVRLPDDIARKQLRPANMAGIVKITNISFKNPNEVLSYAELKALNAILCSDKGLRLLITKEVNNNKVHIMASCDDTVTSLRGLSSDRDSTDFSKVLLSVATPVTTMFFGARFNHVSPFVLEYNDVERYDEFVSDEISDILCINTDIGYLTGRIILLENGLTSGKLHVKSGDEYTGSESGSVIDAKISELEKKIDQMTGGKLGSSEQEERECNMIVGGLDGFSDEQSATFWVLAKMSDIVATDSFTKGDWNGLLFFKVDSPATRTKAVDYLRKARLQYESKVVWAKEDLLIQKRAPESFLFGRKKQLIAWGYSKEEVYVNTSHLSLSVAGTAIVKSKVVENALQLLWADEWGDWDEFTQSPEVKQLIDRANIALAKSTKGKGKGKKGSKE